MVANPSKFQLMFLSKYKNIKKRCLFSIIISSTAASRQEDSHSTGSQSVVITAVSQTGAQARILWVANFRLHTCLHSLSLSYFWEQLQSYWAPSHKDLDRWLFTSPYKHIAHILLNVFLMVFYSHFIYVITTLCSALRFIKLSLVFNYHLLCLGNMEHFPRSTSGLNSVTSTQTSGNFRQ